MTRAREESEWAQTSTIWAVFANAFRDASKHAAPFTPADINPYARRSEAPPKSREQLRSELRAFYEHAKRRSRRSAKKNEGSSK